MAGSKCSIDEHQQRNGHLSICSIVVGLVSNIVWQKKASLQATEMMRLHQSPIAALLNYIDGGLAVKGPRFEDCRDLKKRRGR